MRHSMHQFGPLGLQLRAVDWGFRVRGSMSEGLWAGG